MILWFTYVKGAWRALTGKFGAGITFKTTLKGAGRLLDSVLTDLWMPTLCFILSAVSLGVGIHKLVGHAIEQLSLTVSRGHSLHIVDNTDWDGNTPALVWVCIARCRFTTAVAACCVQLVSRLA